MKQLIKASFRPNGPQYVYMNDEPYNITKGQIVDVTTSAGNVRQLMVESAEPWPQNEDFAFIPKRCYLSSLNPTTKKDQ